MSIPKGIFDAALDSAVKKQSFNDRIRLILERLDDTDELLDILLQGVPVKIKKINAATLTRFMKKKYTYSDIHEVIDITKLNASNATVKCQCTHVRYFRSQDEADKFAKDGAYWNLDCKREKDKEYSISGYYCIEDTYNVPYSELRENGVEFEIV